VDSTPIIPLANDEPFWRKGLQYANDAMEECVEATLLHLDAVEDIYMNIEGRVDSDLLNVSRDYVFRSEIIRAGVDKYVSARLKEDPTFFESVFESPLCQAIEQNYWLEGHINIVASFLQSGQDPNMETPGFIYAGVSSPWCNFTQKACALEEPQNFRTAIENSLFSVFLKYGARRDVKLRGTFSFNEKEEFPCTHFVNAVFLHRFSHRFSSQCLRTLDDFLDENSEGAVLELDEIVGALRSRFEVIPQETDPGRIKFFAQITQKIILKGIRAGVKMDMLTPYLKALFPAGWGSALVDIIQNKDESKFYISERSPLKKRPTGTRSVASCKKAKPNPR
jgi:hypothetical protein